MIKNHYISISEFLVPVSISFSPFWIFSSSFIYGILPLTKINYKYFSQYLIFLFAHDVSDVNFILK